MKPLRDTTGNVPGGDRCPTTGKLSWPTRADAKLVIKRANRNVDRRGLAPYRCHAGNHWHIGHLPPAVIHGLIPRSALRPPAD